MPATVYTALLEKNTATLTGLTLNSRQLAPAGSQCSPEVLHSVSYITSVFSWVSISHPALLPRTANTSSFLFFCSSWPCTPPSLKKQKQWKQNFSELSSPHLPICSGLSCDQPLRWWIHPIPSRLFDDIGPTMPNCLQHHIYNSLLWIISISTRVCCLCFPLKNICLHLTYPSSLLPISRCSFGANLLERAASDSSPFFSLDPSSPSLHWNSSCQDHW